MYPFALFLSAVYCHAGLIILAPVVANGEVPETSCDGEVARASDHDSSFDSNSSDLDLSDLNAEAVWSNMSGICCLFFFTCVSLIL